MKKILNLFCTFSIVSLFILILLYGIDKQFSLEQIKQGIKPTDCIFAKNCSLKSFNITEEDVINNRIQQQYNVINSYNKTKVVMK